MPLMPQGTVACVLLITLSAALLCAAGQLPSDSSATRWLLGQRAPNVTAGFIVPLDAQHGVVRRRGLLRSGSLPVLGAVREVGYFYTKISIGEPARTFSLIIDTGSTITYVPCSTCEHCGKHEDAAFNPSKSSTSKRLTCGDPQCLCGSPECQCKADQCYYSRSYAEHSSSEGWLLQDSLGFPDGQQSVPFVFGCENKESGEIYNQAADGILGMGNAGNAFHGQLTSQSVMEGVFSLCFGYPSGGIMLLGDVPLPPSLKMQYTPLVTSLYGRKYGGHYFNVEVDAISVDGTQLPIRKEVYSVGYGAVLDSGTTFTYLPTEAFHAFSVAIGRVAEAKGLKKVGGAEPPYVDICYGGTPVSDPDKLSSVFPTAQIHFGGGVVLEWPPLRYLFAMSPGVYCLGVFENEKPGGTLIGGISVRDVLVQYDRRGQRIGFGPTPCSGLHDALAKVAPSPTTTPAPATTPAPSDGPSPDTKQQQQQSPASGGGSSGKAHLPAAPMFHDVSHQGPSGFSKPPPAVRATGGGSSAEEAKGGASAPRTLPTPGAGQVQAAPRQGLAVPPERPVDVGEVVGDAKVEGEAEEKEELGASDSSSEAEDEEEVEESGQEEGESRAPVAPTPWLPQWFPTASYHPLTLVLIAVAVVPLALLLDGLFHVDGPTRRWVAALQPGGAGGYASAPSDPSPMESGLAGGVGGAAQGVGKGARG